MTRKEILRRALLLYPGNDFERARVGWGVIPREYMERTACAWNSAQSLAEWFDGLKETAEAIEEAKAWVETL